mmetsp:Transcript_13618/g.22719  ORF Transcript_13618/g.22719 Transcript_13618/m.22719 type:complete len:281 (+) Transcript_13618:59-901(+)
MSFGDITKGAFTGTQQRNVGGGKPVDDVGPLSASLQSLQRDCQALKVTITSMRRRKIGPSEKNDLDLKIKSLKDGELRLKKDLDAFSQKVESMPRSEAASKRTVMGKMQKDFDKLKTNIQAVCNESTLIKVVNERGEVETFARTAGAAATAGVAVGEMTRNNANGSVSSSDGSTVFRMGQTANAATQGKQLQQQMDLKPLLQGKEVDDAILAEREQDIKKMNKDLVLVNEMFKDMAELVDKQGGKINEIATSADKSHERAKAGLSEVNQASEHQTTCVVS